MNVRGLTARMAALCLDAEVDCRYEYFAERWRWNFYRDGVRIASKLDPDAALRFAVDLVSKSE